MSYHRRVLSHMCMHRGVAWSHMYMHRGVAWSHMYMRRGVAWSHMYMRRGVAWSHMYMHSGAAWLKWSPKLLMNTMEVATIPTEYMQLKQCSGGPLCTGMCIACMYVYNAIVKLVQ